MARCVRPRETLWWAICLTTVTTVLLRRDPLPIPIPTRGHRRCSSHRAAVIAHQTPPPPSRHFKSASSWCIEKVTTNAQKHTGSTPKARDHGGKSACGAQCPRKPTAIPLVIPPFMTPLVADRLVIPPIRRRRDEKPVVWLIRLLPFGLPSTARSMMAGQFSSADGRLPIRQRFGWVCD